jgi:signal peptidase I
VSESEASTGWPRRIIVGSSPRRTALRAAVLAVCTFLVFRFVFLPVRISGESMEPTYANGSFNLVSLLRFRFRQPRRGDVVAIRMAGRHVMLFKRVLALPGERVAFRKGVLVIDGREVEESYVKRPCDWEMKEVVVGPNELYVAGDNRAMPIETHAHGRADRNRVIGGPVF